MLKKLFILLGLLTLVGCASTAEKARENLTNGMTQEQVLDIMGEPSRKLGKEWYYAGDHDLILHFDDNGIYQSLETSAPEKGQVRELDSNEQRFKQIREEERERSISSPDSERMYQ